MVPGAMKTPKAAILGILVVLVPLAYSRARQPNVILVVVDTLRADRVGVYGNARGLTPFLDGLARRGVLFRNAYAASSWTCPSVASLFTSRYPSQHHVTTYRSKLPDAERTLAEDLAAGGYVTLGLSANLRLAGAFGWGQGFASWRVYPEVTKLPANRLRREGLRALDRAWSAGSSAPFFLYLQYMEPHPPYDPPPSYRERFGDPSAEGTDPAEANRKVVDPFRWKELSAADVRLLASLYDGEVAYLDHELARLFAALDRRGLLRDAIVVVTADHGEEFNEHELMGHGFGLYNQELRVPLIIAGRGVPAGRVVDDDVSLVDVAPTILALAGLPRDARFEGRSLVPAFSADAPSRDVIAELAPTNPSFDVRHHSAAIVRGTQKLMVLAPNWGAVLGSVALYDLASDPGEVHAVLPLSLPDSPLRTRGQALWDALLREEDRVAHHNVTQPEEQPLDPEQRERLRALGYVD
jgi:arylsulfatase A-like enzyme